MMDEKSRSRLSDERRAECFGGGTSGRCRTIQQNLAREFRRAVAHTKRGGSADTLLAESGSRGCWNAVRKISDFSVHRTVARVKVEIGRCEVCGEKRAVYRSREARAGVWEERCSGGAEFEHRKVARCEQERA